MVSTDYSLSLVYLYTHIFSIVSLLFWIKPFPNGSLVSEHTFTSLFESDSILVSPVKPSPGKKQKVDFLGKSNMCLPQIYIYGRRDWSISFQILGVGKYCQYPPI